MDTVTLAHGSGGSLTNQLINELFRRYFDNPYLAEAHDAERPMILLTTHRRETWGEPMRRIGRAVADARHHGILFDTMGCACAYWPARHVKAYRSPSKP